MKKRRIGQDGFEIGEVGLGCWQFGGDFGPMEEQTALSIMETAVEQGTDFFDTADVYGAGRSEKLIGHFLKSNGISLRVATKFGRSGDVYPDRYSREALRESVQVSLERLGLESLDLLQLHCLPTEILREGAIFDWLRDLQAEGLIRHFGASVESIRQGLLCLEQEGLLSLQIIYNIFRQKLTDQLLPLAAERGVGLIVRLPLASGLLAGKYTQETTFADSDHRTFNRDGQCFNVGETFAGLPFERGVELADALKSHVPQDMTMAQMALRWILDHEAVSVIIPGASSPDQVRSNTAVSGFDPLPDDLHETLRTFYNKRVHEHIRGDY
jgi:aryl-alcohol dehydrogenase-like predicted oxidoreductase